MRRVRVRILARVVVEGRACVMAVEMWVFGLAVEGRLYVLVR